MNYLCLMSDFDIRQVLTASVSLHPQTLKTMKESLAETVLIFFFPVSSSPQSQFVDQFSALKIVF